MRFWPLRMVILTLAGGATLLCTTGHLANSWAAWAPPSEANPNHDWLVYSARFYGSLAFCFFVISLLAVFFRFPADKGDREMARQKRRIPRYKRADPQEAKRQADYPPNAVEADLTQQVPNNSYSAKPLYYRDVEFDCADCGRHEVWTATQQKWWYEVAKGSLYTTAKRCRACRAVVRAARERQRQASQNPK